MSYDLKEKDPTGFMRMPIGITLTAIERDVLARALEALYFAEMLKERSLPLDYIGLRQKLLSPPSS